MRFSSLIRFVPTYADVQACIQGNPHLPEACSPYFISNSTHSPHGGFTKGAFDCNVVGFRNPQDSFLYHLIPINEAEEDIDLLPIQHTLANDLRTLAAGGGQIRGLLTSGMSYEAKRDHICTSSERLYQGIRQALAPFQNVSPSIIWGRRAIDLTRALSTVYTMADDTWRVFAGAHIQTLQNLQQTFRHIQIAPGDTLELPSGETVQGPMALSAGSESLIT